MKTRTHKRVFETAFFILLTTGFLLVSALKGNAQMPFDVLTSQQMLLTYNDEKSFSVERIALKKLEIDRHELWNPEYVKQGRRSTSQKEDTIYLNYRHIPPSIRSRNPDFNRSENNLLAPSIHIPF